MLTKLIVVITSQLHIYQMIMLYILNSYSAICQLFLKYLANFFTIFSSLLKSHLLSDEAYPNSILHLVYVLTYISEKLKNQTYRNREQIGGFQRWGMRGC